MNIIFYKEYNTLKAKPFSGGIDGNTN